MEILEVEDARSVVLEDEQLEIRQLTVTGEPPVTAKILVEEGDDLESVIRRMIDVGAVVLRQGRNRAALDSFGSEVERLIEAITETAATQLPEVLTRHAESLGEILAKHFDANQIGSVQQQMVSIVGGE